MPKTVMFLRDVSVKILRHLGGEKTHFVLKVRGEMSRSLSCLCNKYEVGASRLLA